MAERFGFQFCARTLFLNLQELLVSFCYFLDVVETTYRGPETRADTRVASHKGMRRAAGVTIVWVGGEQGARSDTEVEKERTEAQRRTRNI